MTIVNIPNNIAEKAKKLWLDSHPLDVPTARNILTKIIAEYVDNHKEDDND